MIVCALTCNNIGSEILKTLDISSQKAQPSDSYTLH